MEITSIVLSYCLFSTRIVLLLLSSSQLLEAFCEGVWKTSDDAVSYQSPAVAARVPFNVSSADDLQRWKRYACPVEQARHSCFSIKTNGRVKSSQVENLNWVTMDKNCAEFWSSHFLESIKNRVIVFIGDSVMAQIWIALVCSLSSTTPVTFHPTWSSLKRWRNYECPFGQQHCHLSRGIVTIKLANVTIKYFEDYGYSKSGFEANLKTNMLGPNDIVFFNYGLHSSDNISYLQSIESFFSDIGLRRQQSSDVPHVLFLETLPQHFGGENGEYDKEKLKNITTCLPVKDYIKAHANDHRNRAVERIAANYNFSHLVVPLADGLRSRYDSHVEKNQLNNFDGPDCSHYCFPSSVFNFINR